MSTNNDGSRSADIIYDAFADEYRDYSATKSSYISAVDQLLVERFAGRVETVIDYGAGDGVRGINVFKKLGAQTRYQADRSDGMIAKCRALEVAKQVWDI